jgi:hypothetical protein
LFGGLFSPKADASVLLYIMLPAQPTLIPMGDESAMNAEGLGVVFSAYLL